MNEGEQVSLRYLPQGVECAAVIRSTQGRVMELDVQARTGDDFILDAPVEIKATDTIYLGVVERRQNERVWINVEHLLDRKTLATIQAAWKE
jgi:hypothetical protein